MAKQTVKKKATATKRKRVSLTDVEPVKRKKGSKPKAQPKKKELKGFQLNEQQIAIKNWVLEKEGSLIVVARAGCGKTTALIKVIIRAIIEEALGDVALMAFNKSISNEFNYQLAQLAKDLKDDRYTNFKLVNAATCHSFGFGAWRRVAPNVTLNQNKVMDLVRNFEMAETDRENIYKRAASAIAKSVSLAKQNCFGVVNRVNDYDQWHDLLEHHAIDEMAAGYTMKDIIDASLRVYYKSLQLNYDVIDFDDMILAPLINDAQFYKKDWVLIDEAQDTNAARRLLATRIMKKESRLVAVGDDRQAIYGFTGADSDALDIIKDDFDATTLPLTVTYRCPKLVVKQANKHVPDLVAHPNAPEGVVRSLPDYTKQPIDPKDKSKGTKNIPWFVTEKPAITSAILCRKTAPLIETAYSMLKHEIGCRVLGREIGEGLITLAHKWKRIKTLGALITKIEEYKLREVEKWTKKQNEQRAQAIEDKCDTVTVICQKLVEEGKQNLDDFDTFVRSLFGDVEPGETPKVVTLATIHKAKGLEWPVVYILYRAQTMPSPYATKDWQLKQEENIEYVGDTRSQGELVDITQTLV